MKFMKNILFLALLWFVASVHAQTNDGEALRTNKYKTVYQKKEFLHQLNLQAGYLSNSFTNPGLMVQLESPYKVRTKKINRFRLFRHAGLVKKERFKTIRYDFLAGAKTAFIYNNQDHNNWLFELNSTLRRTGRRGWQRELMVGLSYNLEFLNGPVYEQENGEFKKRILANRGYAMPVLGMGIGKEFKNKSAINLNMAIYIPTRAPLGVGWGAFGISFIQPLNKSLK